jgi:hypothetical protein
VLQLLGNTALRGTVEVFVNEPIDCARKARGIPGQERFCYIALLLGGDADSSLTGDAQEASEI